MSEPDAQHVENAQLCRVALRGRNGDLGAGPCIYGVIRELGYRAPDHIDYREDMRTARLALLHRGDGVGRLAGL